MTDVDIKRQQADALLAHREASIHAEHVKERLTRIALAIKAVGERLQSSPKTFVLTETPDHWGDGVPLTRISRSTGKPPAEFPDTNGIVDLEAVAALVKEMQDAHGAVAEAAKNASKLGVPV